ncbi:MAG: hypothetical protein QE486_02720 [Burkholderiaceae bacterium]|nr:hypothetical protein [Burkholderiaceae bacterium]
MNSKIIQFGCIVIGGLLLLWPAIYNDYPLLYSDSHVFISQPVAGFMNWDKPYIYGPLILLFHAWQTLWLVVIAQALLVSHLLWLVIVTLTPEPKAAQAVSPSPSLVSVTWPVAKRHLFVCGALALASTAPWFVSFLMPDIFAAIAVLCIFLLGFSTRLNRVEVVWLVVLGALAISVHLSHLVIAAACLLGVLCLGWRRLALAVLPLACAIALLLGTNLYAFQNAAISPHGSVFMLARLSGDGNTKEILEKYCAQKNWYLCAWVDRLPTDSDEFLWNGKGPVWSHPGGPIGLAPEASEIVSYVLRTRPWPVLLSGLNNMAQQLWMIQLGDTLHSDHLDVTVAKSVREHFAAAELKSMNGSRQMNNTLVADAVWFSRLNVGVFYCAAVFGLYVLFVAWRKRTTQLNHTHATFERDHTKLVVSFILILWLGVVANAFATGALSKPHHRYQARIAWLLVLPPLLLLRNTVPSTAPKPT